MVLSFIGDHDVLVSPTEDIKCFGCGEVLMKAGVPLEYAHFTELLDVGFLLCHGCGDDTPFKMTVRGSLELTT